MPVTGTPGLSTLPEQAVVVVVACDELAELQVPLEALTT